MKNSASWNDNVLLYNMRRLKILLLRCFISLTYKTISMIRKWFVVVLQYYSYIIIYSSSRLMYRHSWILFRVSPSIFTVLTILSFLLSSLFFLFSVLPFSILPKPLLCARPCAKGEGHVSARHTDGRDTGALKWGSSRSESKGILPRSSICWDIFKNLQNVY